MTIILAATQWKDNGELIAACHELGYINQDDWVLDVTYGSGVWWRDYYPNRLVTNDLSKASEAAHHYDFRRLPKRWEGRFDVVAYDPPYKLNGTPSEPDEQYGVDIPTKWEDRMKLIMDGIPSSAKALVPGGLLLMKCKDQVSRNKKRWQTFDARERAAKSGLELIDMGLLVREPRKQDARRPQRHFHSNFSNLLVFQKHA